MSQDKKTKKPSNEPPSEHRNPVKPDRTSDDVGEILALCDRRLISVNWLFPRELININFSSKMTPWLLES